MCRRNLGSEVTSQRSIMPGSMARGIDKILSKVRKLGKMHVSYETLSDELLSMKEMQSGRKMWGRSKVNALPDDVPQGYLAVYVGNERKRFVISTQYLRHELFKALLKKSEEEFGFQNKGGLTLACEPMYFERMLWLIATNNPVSNMPVTHEHVMIECYIGF